MLKHKNIDKIEINVKTLLVFNTMLMIIVIKKAQAASLTCLAL